MTTAQLRLLGILALELGADAIEQLDIALARVLAQRGDKGPRHGPGGLAANGCIGAVGEQARVS